MFKLECTYMYFTEVCLPWRDSIIISIYCSLLIIKGAVFFVLKNGVNIETRI